MDREMIRRVIERSFKNAGDLLRDVTLTRVAEAAHVPGSAVATSEEIYQARLFRLPPRRSKSGIEEGPVLNKSLQISLLISPDIEPMAGDVLGIGGRSYTISQVGEMDHGAALLFEVWYQ